MNPISPRDIERNALTRRESQNMSQSYAVSRDSDDDDYRMWRKEADAWNRELENPMYGRR